MIVFICLDDNNGMLFHDRRLSRDKAVAEDMLNYAGDKKIRMNLYSAKLFYAAANRVTAEENFPEDAEKEDCCFVENIPLKPYEDRVETIVVYYWNRIYPADVYLDLDLERDWEVVESREFAGNSHEKITRKIYKPGNR